MRALLLLEGSDDLVGHIHGAVDVLDVVELLETIDEALDKADVVMMLRLQLERMDGVMAPSQREYFRFYGLDREKLALVPKDELLEKRHHVPIERYQWPLALALALLAGCSTAPPGQDWLALPAEDVWVIPSA